MTRVIDHCGMCGSQDLRIVLSLGTSPPTCQMLPIGSQVVEERFPLELVSCDNCDLVQLSTIVDPKEVFPLDYPYSSRHSRALHDNFEDLAHQATSWVDGLTSDDLVVDIGANDGTLLGKMTGCRKVGVEPTGQAARIPGCAYQEFFSENVAHRILENHGPAKIITACNVLAHVENIHDVMRGIRLLLAKDGILVAENHDLGAVVGGQWDTVYHEHLRFYSPSSFYRLLEMHGLAAQTWDYIPTHGGSFRMIAAKGGWACPPPPDLDYNFDRLARMTAECRDKIRKTISPGMWGIGASARATTIINYCELDVDDIACVVEVAGSDKIGRYVPGTRIPIVDEAELFARKPTRAMLFAWHMADMIIPKLREKQFHGTIVVPLPLPWADRTRQSFAYMNDPWGSAKWEGLRDQAI